MSLQLHHIETEII